MRREGLPDATVRDQAYAPTARSADGVGSGRVRGKLSYFSDIAELFARFLSGESDPGRPAASSGDSARQWALSQQITLTPFKGLLCTV